jgi:hypothetical protein
MMITRVLKRDCTRAINAFVNLGAGQIDDIFPTISVVIGSDLSKITLSMMDEYWIWGGAYNGGIMTSVYI